jgi:RHS repeat-associated protein
MSAVELDADGDGTPETRLDYEYDASGIRVAQTKTTDGNADGDFVDPGDTAERTDYLVDYLNATGYAQILEESVDGTLSKTYTIGHDVFAETIAAGQIRHLLKDGHGSTRMLVEALGQLITESGTQQIFAYDAYGNPVGFDPAFAITALLYNGEQTDKLTGRQYLRARYYDAATGSFNRLDPFAGNLKDPRSFHKYLYTHGNPVLGRDPSGEWSLGGAMVGMGIGATLGGMNAWAHGGGAEEIFWGAVIGGVLGALTGGFAPGVTEWAKAAMSCGARRLAAWLLLREEKGSELFWRPLK